MHIPDPDTSEFAALIEFTATSGRHRAHPAVEEKADALIAHFWSERAHAMTQSVAAVAKAATSATSSKA